MAEPTLCLIQPVSRIEKKIMQRFGAGLVG